MTESWTGFYGPSLNIISNGLVANEPIDWDGVNECLARNPQNESHVEFVLTAVFALKKYLGVEGADLCVLKRFLRKKYTSNNWRLMGEVIESGGGLTKKVVLNFLSINQKPDGFLVDIKGDASTQYHSYLLLLLILFAPNDVAIEKRIRIAFLYVEKLMDSEEPFSRGRGSLQAFGYISFYVAGMIAIKKRVIKSGEIKNVMSYISRLLGGYKYRSPFIHNVGFYSDFSGEMLHGYNTKDDYPAFVRFWTVFLDCIGGSMSCFENESEGRFIQSAGNGWRLFDISRSSIVEFEDVSWKPRLRSKLLFWLRGPKFTCRKLAGGDGLLVDGFSSLSFYSGFTELFFEVKGYYKTFYLSIYGVDRLPKIDIEGSVISESTSNEEDGVFRYKFHISRRGVVRVVI